MAKSNPVDETRIADPVEPTKPQPRANVKKARRTAKAQKRRTRRKGAVGSRNGTKPASGKQTKQQTCLDLLGRREGATIEDLRTGHRLAETQCARLPGRGGQKEARPHTRIGEARCGTPPLSHPDHGLNAMDRNCVGGARAYGPSGGSWTCRKAKQRARRHATWSCRECLRLFPRSVLTELRSEWRRLYRGQPPRLSRDLSVRASPTASRNFAMAASAKRPDGSLPARARRCSRAEA